MILSGIRIQRLLEKIIIIKYNYVIKQKSDFDEFLHVSLIDYLKKIPKTIDTGASRPFGHSAGFAQNEFPKFKAIHLIFSFLSFATAQRA